MDDLLLIVYGWRHDLQASLAQPSQADLRKFLPQSRVLGSQLCLLPNILSRRVARAFSVQNLGSSYSLASELASQSTSRLFICSCVSERIIFC